MFIRKYVIQLGNEYILALTYIYINIMKIDYNDGGDEINERKNDN
jgi:hypothetical protein